MLRADIVAGISVAGLMLPEAVAYAGIAGLSPGRAILAAIAGCVVYAAIGRSRFAIVAPTSSSAAILAAALATMPVADGVRDAYATIIVAMVGAIFLVAAALRLDGLAGFIARPVLRGFAFGLAVTIVLRQLPAIAGLQLAAPDLFRLAWTLLSRAPDWHPASVVTGSAALAALLAIRRVPMVPGAAIVLAGGIAASAMFDLPGRGVATVGAIALRPGWPAMPDLSFATLSHLAQMTVPLVLILFAESWGTMRSLALGHGDVVRPGRELVALGLANLGAGLAQGMPVGAGLSASSASEAAGASTRLATLAAAVALAALVLMAMPLIALLPQPVLAAVVVAALTHALDPAPILRLWRLDRDQYVACAAALGVLMFGVLNGMLIAVALSLAALIRRLATPRLIALGRLGDGHTYVDIARHADAVAPPGVAIWRPAQPLFFGNAERVLGGVEAKLRQAPGLRAAILSLEESVDLDSTALDALIEFDRRIACAGLALRLARVHDHVRDLLAAAGAGGLVDRSSYSVDDAVRALDLEGAA